MLVIAVLVAGSYGGTYMYYVAYNKGSDVVVYLF